MGFVVYSKNDGELLRYYDNRSKAQAQVTGHNRKAIVDILKGNEYVKEWDLCEWTEYEKIYQQYYTTNKAYLLTRSSW